MTSSPKKLAALIVLLRRCDLARGVRTNVFVVENGTVDSASISVRDTFAIGDSHGDEDFFFKQLLSTGKFVAELALDSEEVRLGPDGYGYTRSQYMDFWARAPFAKPWAQATKLTGKRRDGVVRPQLRWKVSDRKPDFRIVLLGDLVDRGTRSKEQCELVYRLRQHPSHGHKLEMLLGNHEEFQLRYMLQWAKDDEVHGGWGPEARARLFFAMDDTYEYYFMKFLTERPLLYLRDGMLMAHAGLSDITAEAARRGASKQLRKTAQATTPQEIVDFVNAEAKAFFGKVWACARRRKNGWLRTPESCSQIEPPPVLSSDDTSDNEPRASITWFRGYTAVPKQPASKRDVGCGSGASCEMATHVGQMFGAQYHVYGHSTKPRVTMFCEDFPVHVFAVDNSYKMCQKAGEGACDYAVNKRHSPRSKDKFMPQSLHMQRAISSGSVVIETCLYTTETKERKLCLPQEEFDTLGDLGYREQECSGDMSKELGVATGQTCPAGQTCAYSCAKGGGSVSVFCPKGNIYRRDAPQLVDNGRTCKQEKSGRRKRQGPPTAGKYQRH